MMLTPVMGQEVTPEPDVAVVVDVPAEGVVRVAQDNSHLVGMIVVALISVTFSLVDGYKSDKFLVGVGQALKVVRDGAWLLGLIDVACAIWLAREFYLLVRD